MKFQLDNFNRNIPDEELIRDMKRVAKDLDKGPTINEYNELGSYNAATIIRRFGSWLKAYKKAGWK